MSECNLVILPQPFKISVLKFWRLRYLHLSFFLPPCLFYPCPFLLPPFLPLFFSVPLSLFRVQFFFWLNCYSTKLYKSLKGQNFSSCRLCSVIYSTCPAQLIVSIQNLPCYQEVFRVFFFHNEIFISPREKHNVMNYPNFDS